MHIFMAKSDLRQRFTFFTHTVIVFCSTPI